MRSSGYKDTAHALAELIDNSVQAGLRSKELTNIEVIGIDQQLVSEAGRKTQFIKEVAVYDNASGMNKDLLHIALQFGNGTNLTADKQISIGKFGMGLPNSSISQCRRVEVYSWQNGETYFSYLDLDEIEEGEMHVVPEPVKKEIPKTLLPLIKSQIRESGTLVVWSKIDRATWKRSETLFQNSAKLIGRIYRYFLEAKEATIRLATYIDDGRNINKKSEDFIKPNDPLFLMKGTSDPVPYNNSPAFDLTYETDVKVFVDGQEHLVHLKFSMSKKATRDAGGASHIGRRAKFNQGISLIRAKRELELNSTFDNTDPRERWWGVEVSFEPALDDIFGVSNNKQAATLFRRMNLDEDAKSEEKTREEFKDYLREINDPRLPIYLLSETIDSSLSTLRDQIGRQAKGKKTQGEHFPQGSADQIATKATEKRKKDLGKTGESDKAEKDPPEKKQQELTKELTDKGINAEVAEEIAIDAVRSNVKFLFQEGRVPGAVMFDVQARAGKLIVTLNDNHPVQKLLFDSIEEEDKGTSDASKSLRLMLQAWARLEDESSRERRAVLSDIREDWGRIVRDFLIEAEMRT